MEEHLVKLQEWGRKLSKIDAVETLERFWLGYRNSGCFYVFYVSFTLPPVAGDAIKCLACAAKRWLPVKLA